MSEHFSNNDRGYKLKMWLDLVDQNIVKNYSNYRIQIFLVSGGWSFTGYNCTGYVDFDGGRRYGFSIGSLGAYETKKIHDETYKVYHNQDGTKNFGIMARLNGQGGYSPNTLTIDGFYVDVPKINRISTTSDIDAYFGQQITINISKNNSDFRHKVLYTFGNKSGIIGDNIDTSVNWTVPTSLVSEIGANKSADGTLILETYSGTNKLGQNNYRLTLKINDTNGDVKPTFQDFELIETNQNVKNVLQSSSYFIQILSNIQCSFKDAIGSFGVGIKRYHAEIVGKPLSIDNDNGKFGIMNFSGDITISAYIVDERGIKSDVKTKTIRILPYFSPTIFFTAKRVGSRASTINTSTTYKVANLSVEGIQKNTVEVKFSTSSDGGITFTPNDGNSNIGSNQIMESVNLQASLAGDFTPTLSFIVRATIRDRFSQPISYDFQISTEEVAISYHREGVGIGMVHNKYRVQVAPGDVSLLDGVYRIKDNEIQNHRLTDSNGTCIKYTSGDANNILKTGFYNVNNVTNMPKGDMQWWYLTVISNADTYVMQQANSFFNDKIYTRQKRGNIWSNWVALQQEQKPVVERFPDTEWKEATGEKNGKLLWRVSSKVLYLDVSNKFEDNGTYLLGSFPREYLEHYKDALMLSCAEFSLNDSRFYLFEINLDGTCFIMNAKKGQHVRAVLTIPI